MSGELKLSILSPERRLVQDISVDEITLPTSEGEIEILPTHAAMIGTLETGIFHYRTVGNEVASGVISSGFFEVKDDVIVVTAETIELKSEINVDRAKKAQQVAEDSLRSADLDEHSFRKYQLKLQRALIRQQLASQG
jgi:F-type H+-transporting ATPase subunit epsilon